MNARAFVDPFDFSFYFTRCMEKKGRLKITSSLVFGDGTAVLRQFTTSSEIINITLMKIITIPE